MKWIYVTGIEKERKKSMVSNFKVLLQRLSGGTDEIHDRYPHSLESEKGSDIGD
jgi:hypothetical protein